MTSLTQIAYGSRVRRHGRSRFRLSYHSTSRRDRGSPAAPPPMEVPETPKSPESRTSCFVSGFRDRLEAYPIFGDARASHRLTRLDPHRRMVRTHWGGHRQLPGAV